MFYKRVKIYNETIKEREVLKDYHNYLLGRYMIYAYNDPKKYPKKPFLQVSEKKDWRDVKNMFKYLSKMKKRKNNDD